MNRPRQIAWCQRCGTYYVHRTANACECGMRLMPFDLVTPGLVRALVVALIALGIVMILTTPRRAHAQDAGPLADDEAPNVTAVIRGGRVDWRPNGVDAFVRKIDRHCAWGPGCDNGVGTILPCVDGRGTHAAGARTWGCDAGIVEAAQLPALPVPDRVVATVDREPPRHATPRTDPRDDPRVPWKDVVVGIFAGLGALAYAIGRWRSRHRPVLTLPVESLPHGEGHPRADTLPLGPVYGPPLPPEWAGAVERWEAAETKLRERERSEQHQEELRARIVGMVGCRPSEIRAEPNPHGQGFRAWIGTGTWPQVLAADDGVAVSWTLGAQTAALARLLVEIRRRRRVTP